jgi:hypothetical protein
MADNLATPRHERDQSFFVPVQVPSETNFGAGPSQKYFGHGAGPKKTFWFRSCSEKILVLVLVKKTFGPGPGQKKKFGPGTTLPISSNTPLLSITDRD